MLDAGSIIIIWIPMITSGWEKKHHFRKIQVMVCLLVVRPVSGLAYSKPSRKNRRKASWTKIGIYLE